MSLTPAERKMVGGSDLAALVGDSPWGTPLSVYARIVGDAPDEDAASKRRGRHLEAGVRALYCEEMGARMLEHAKAEHPRLKYTRASVDGIAQRAGRRVLEVKTAGLSEMRHWGEAGTDNVPRAYLYQTTWYAGVAGLCGLVDTQEVDVAALIAGDLRVYHVPYDAEMFGLLEEAVERFWVDHVVPRRPPPITSPTVDLGAVNHLYRAHSGGVLLWDSLTPEGQVAFAEYLRAKDAEDAAAELRATWEVRAKLALGQAPQLVGVPEHLGGGHVDWKQSKGRQVTDWEALAVEFKSHVSPECYEHWKKRHTTTKEGARPFVARGRKTE
jgi:putative phage-type endonuclease